MYFYLYNIHTIYTHFSFFSIVIPARWFCRFCLKTFRDRGLIISQLRLSYT